MIRPTLLFICYSLILFSLGGFNHFHNRTEGSDLPLAQKREPFQFHSNWQSSATLINDIPVLCYHHVKKDLVTGNAYTISEKLFYEQMQTLYDSGFHTILPDQLLSYNKNGIPLPGKSIIISFDDSHLNQYEYAYPILEKFNFKAVFFIMTVTIGKQNYMSKAQIKELSDKGHPIGCHTWDHMDVRSLNEIDWRRELDIPMADLEKITGKQVEYFAYPNGAWNTAAIIELKKRNIKAAFQLADKDGTHNYPFAIRRLMVAGNWSGRKLLRLISYDSKPVDKISVSK